MADEVPEFVEWLIDDLRQEHVSRLWAVASPEDDGTTQLVPVDGDVAGGWSWKMVSALASMAWKRVWVVKSHLIIQCGDEFLSILVQMWWNSMRGDVVQGILEHEL
jgi:hypothetical protein